MNTDNTYANFLKTEMAKVLSERDKIKERHEQAMKLLVERGREIDFLKNENKVLKERFEKAVNDLHARRFQAARESQDLPTFLPMGRAR